MRVLLQRVLKASVTVNGRITGDIGKGLLIFVGVEDSDSQADVDWLARKVSRIRIFDDDKGIMNLSVLDVKADVLVVSQFTLHADIRKGNRPSYSRASKPETAVPLYLSFVNRVSEELARSVQTGEFGAKMAVSLINDGPVTIWIDTNASIPE